MDQPSPTMKSFFGLEEKKSRHLFRRYSKEWKRCGLMVSDLCDNLMDSIDEDELRYHAARMRSVRCKMVDLRNTVRAWHETLLDYKIYFNQPSMKGVFKVSLMQLVSDTENVWFRFKRQIQDTAMTRSRNLEDAYFFRLNQFQTGEAPLHSIGSGASLRVIYIARPEDAKAIAAAEKELADSTKRRPIAPPDVKIAEPIKQVEPVLPAKTKQKEKVPKPTREERWLKAISQNVPYVYSEDEGFDASSDEEYVDPSDEEWVAPVGKKSKKCNHKAPDASKRAKKARGAGDEIVYLGNQTKENPCDKEWTASVAPTRRNKNIAADPKMAKAAEVRSDSAYSVSDLESDEESGLAPTKKRKAQKEDEDDVLVAKKKFCPEA